MKITRLINTYIAGLLLGFASHAQWLDPQPNETSIPSGTLDSLLVDGAELHPTLKTESVDNLPAGRDFPANPWQSTAPAFIESMARYGSQGRLDGEGMNDALFAQYTDGSSEIGFYGLAAENESVALQREQDLREIWAHNHGLDRTHIHRQGLVLLVVWIRTGDELPAAWHAVKQWAAQKMSSANTP